jgi:thioredoxin 1
MIRKTNAVIALVMGAALLLAGCDLSPPSAGPSSSASLKESSAAEMRQQLDQPGVVLVKFGAPWCRPCRQIDGELAKLTESGTTARVVAINIDDESELATEHNITSIPRIMLFKDGNKVQDHVGYADLAEIQTWIASAAQNE